MKNTSQQYLNSEAHGYLMEAKACKLLLKDLERIRAKLKRHIEKEAADREAESVLRNPGRHGGSISPV